MLCLSRGLAYYVRVPFVRLSNHQSTSAIINLLAEKAPYLHHGTSVSKALHYTRTCFVLSDRSNNLGCIWHRYRLTFTGSSSPHILCGTQLDVTNVLRSMMRNPQHGTSVIGNDDNQSTDQTLFVLRLGTLL